MQYKMFHMLVKKKVSKKLEDALYLLLQSVFQTTSQPCKFSGQQYIKC